MRILFTGSSSFTGYWFVRELVAAGHSVVATFRGDGGYAPIRAERTRLVRALCPTRFDCSFGSDAFLGLIKTDSCGFDVLCHHGAEADNYRSADFDPFRAAAANLYHLPDVLTALKDQSCHRLVLTGSVFEQNEGAGSAPLRAFSPYGLSKGLTAAAAEFYSRRHGFTFEKFVIANPFGPYEEERFTSYLMRSWLKGDTARVGTPRYVRDNIPVSLLARAYVAFVAAAPAIGSVRQVNPSCYSESQGAFARRVGEAVASLLALPCRIDFADQMQFSEPPVRINTDPIDAAALGWSEAQAWKDFVAYYCK
jgi:UDP-glucose 4-epimerase